jgi:hypothetical protein
LRTVPDAVRLLEPIREAAREMPRDAIPALVGELARLQAELLLPPLPSEPSSGNVDRMLLPKEAATLIGRSVDWIYAHRHELPVTRLTSGRWILSEAKLRRWLESRSRR